MLGCRFHSGRQWRLEPGRICIIEPARHSWPACEVECFDRTAVPRFLRRAWGMASFDAGLHGLVGLAYARSLHGAGGIYLDGLVVLGRTDIAQIAAGVLTRLRPLRPQAGRYWRRRGRLVLSREQVLEGAARAVLYHELGHAIAAQRGLTGPFSHEEANADYWAGRLAALASEDPRLGELVFGEIGCETNPCSHPSPASRMRAFRLGYRDQAERSWQESG